MLFRREEKGHQTAWRVLADCLEEVTVKLILRANRNYPGRLREETSKRMCTDSLGKTSCGGPFRKLQVLQCGSGVDNKVRRAAGVWISSGRSADLVQYFANRISC